MLRSYLYYILLLCPTFLQISFCYTEVADFKNRHDFIRFEIENTKDDLLHNVIFAVNHLNLDKLEKILHDVSDPFLSTYGNHLSRDEVYHLTSNTEGLEKLLSYFELHNVEVVGKTLYGEYITARTTVSNWETIFSTKFFEFKHYSESTKKVYRADHYTLDNKILPFISGVFNVIQLPLPKTSISPVKKVAMSSLATSSITPATINRYYNIFSNVGNRSLTQTIYSAIGQYFSSADLAKFQAKYGIPNHPMDADPQHRDSNSTCLHDIDDCSESSLDVQYLTAIAQQTNSTIIYDSENDAFVTWITSVANQAKPSAVYSISYGIQESDLVGYDSYVIAFNTQAKILGVMGTTIVASSGDDGAPGYKARYKSYYCGYDPSFPASSPYVLAVGATMGPETNSAEVVCDAKKGGVITSGGGFSKLFTAPSFQNRAISSYFHSVSTAPVAGYNASGRGLPDVSLAGKYYETIIGGKTYYMSGTSASAPTVAAMITLINAARKRNGKSTLGWVNPAIYAYNGSFANDITSGNIKCTLSVCCNEGFYAAKGWDPTTGFGSVDFTLLYNKFSGAITIPSAAVTKSPSAVRSSIPTTSLAGQSPSTPSTPSAQAPHGNPPSTPSTPGQSPSPGTPSTKFPSTTTFPIQSPTQAPYGIVTQDKVMCDLAAALSPANIYNGWICTDGQPSTSYCDYWDGVVCTTDSFVYGLYFESLPKGSLPSSLGQLISLEFLSIVSSNTRGTIPTTFGILKKLTSLYLENTLLSGSIPSSLGLLSNLQVLSLFNNYLNRRLPTSLGLLTNLETLDITLNFFSGTLPASLGKLRGLQELSASNNFLTGSIPSAFVTLSSIVSISLSMNHLTGSVSSSFFATLTTLKFLSLDYNFLSGTLPQSKSSWTTSYLQYLDLSNNYLTGKLPSTLSYMMYLIDFYADNNHLSGRLPVIKSVQYLSLSNNHITGSIPRLFRTLSNLHSLSIYNNKITGIIPNTTSNDTLTNLEYVDFSNNELSGTIPMKLGLFSTVREAYFEGNNLKGTIPSSIALNTNLQYVGLGDFLEGTIPSNVLAMTSLDGLFLQGTKLNSRLFQNTSSFSNLGSLTIRSNCLQGTIPSSILLLTKLEYLGLGNRLSGSIPTFLVLLTKLMGLQLDSNSLTSSLPTKFHKLSNLYVLSLSANKLTGKIPSYLSHFSNLQRVNLSQNRFNGTIPSFGNASYLNQLFLQNNALTGSVPASLCSLHYLAYLYVQGNPLTCYSSCLSDIYYSDFGSLSSCKVGSRKPSRMPTLRPTPSPSLTFSPTAAPTPLLKQLTLTNSVRSCFSNCSSNSAKWTLTDICSFYNHTASSCPATAIAMYRNNTYYPSCPPQCVRRKCEAADYCHIYSILALSCGTTSKSSSLHSIHYNSTDTKAIQKKCLSAFKRQVETRTEVTFTTQLTLLSVSYDTLESDSSAKKALVTSVQTSIGNSPKVTISSITSTTTTTTVTLARKTNTGGVEVNRDLLSSSSGVLATFDISQVAENIGYSSTSTGNAVQTMVTNLQTSVSSGAFNTILQAAATAAGTDTFSDAVVNTTITTDSAYTLSPTVTPPTLIPTYVPTAVNTSATKKDKNTNTLYIIIGAAAGGGILLIGIMITTICCLCNSRKTGGDVVPY